MTWSIVAPSVLKAPMQSSITLPFKEREERGREREICDKLLKIAEEEMMVMGMDKVPRKHCNQVNSTKPLGMPNACLPSILPESKNAVSIVLEIWDIIRLLELWKQILCFWVSVPLQFMPLHTWPKQSLHSADLEEPRYFTPDVGWDGLGKTRL